MLKKLPTSPILLAGLIAVISAGILIGFVADSRPTTTDPASSTATATPDPTATASATPTATPAVLSLGEDDITWLDEPKQTSDLKLIRDNQYVEGTSTTYYIVGKKGSYNLILAQATPEGPYVYLDGLLFMESPTTTGKYVLISGYNTQTVNAYVDYTNAEGAPATMLTDLATVGGPSIPSLQLPGTFTLNDTTYVGTDYSTYALFSSMTKDAVSTTVLGTTNWGKVYRVRHKKLDDGSFVESIILRRLDNTGGIFNPKEAGFLRDDMTPAITWNDKTSNASTYRLDGGGSCGSAGGTNTIDSLDGWAKSGTGTDGTVVYEPTDSNNQIIKTWYDLSGGTYTVYSNNETKTYTISYAEFVTKHPIVAYKDAANRIVVMRNTTYGMNAECGKPVVYLYPPTATQVHVSVGATFHKSIPASTGSWDVLAQPNGTLTTTGGEKVSYLYWSGQGKGRYPVITAGTIVARDHVQTVLREQLNQLGFTKQEAADFLEFWAPRMPTTPYTRLTWLGNRELDVLAPMTITPKPDVVIRTFLDFEGLQQPIPLNPQKLSAPARRGFTVMEWGGLLRGK